MARTPTQRAERPYRIIARELQYRLNRKEIARAEFAKDVGIVPNSLDSIMRGYRPFPTEKIDKTAALLTRGESRDAKEKLAEILFAANTPGASRLLLLRSFKEPLQIGYVQWEPFATPRLGTEPSGMLVDLMRLLCDLLQLPHQWRHLKFHEMIGALESGDVDLVVGFVLETLYRRAHASFVPLFLPFRVGINAVTSSDDFPEPDSYAAVLAKLQALATRRENPVKFITVAGELADEYLPAIIPGAKSIQDKEHSIETAIRYHAERSKHLIVFADHVSCQRAIDPDETDGSMRLLFNENIGRFQGGFLLPLDDDDWTDYFQRAFQHLLLAKLPATLDIVNKYASQTAPWLDLGDGNATAAIPSGAMSDQFIGLREWLRLCWDDHTVPLHDAWRRQREEYPKE